VYANELNAWQNRKRENEESVFKTEEGKAIKE
jgi:hypothetical protein